MEHSDLRENGENLMTKQSLEQRVEEMERMNAQLKEALRAAQAANEAKSSFLSSMSHDIRTPMNAIMGMTSIGLSHIDEKSRVQDCLLKIQTASTHLMSLVNDVLDMSRIDSGRMTLNQEAFSLPDLVHDIAVIVRPQSAQKKQTLFMEIGEICEENLIGDPLHLRQILVNIIGNAVKYTQEEGRIRVRFSQRPAEGGALDASENLWNAPEDSQEASESSRNAPGNLQEAPESPKNAPENPRNAPEDLQRTSENPPNVPESGPRVWLDFLCEDNGMGMNPEFLERIFVPFERVQNDATSKIEGTGLGMAIVKNLIDRMGGRISVESKEGEGSCFKVELPILVGEQEEEALSLPLGQSILMAESRDDRAGKMEDYLESSGLVPVRVRSGLDAVTYLTEAQYEGRMPCALLLGQELPDLPVLELASHVRQLAGARFPILLVSEADWAQIEYRAVRAGVSAFVPCPLFKSRLLKTLSSLMESGRKEEGALGRREEDYSGYRILLVEDNELNQEIAVELLSLTGVQVEVAGNGAQALEAFAASEENYFDLIFMDIQMPVMDGYEAARRIRQLPRKDAALVWIVAMTANAFVEDVRRSREAGMNEHVSKPVDFERLQEILHKRLK